MWLSIRREGGLWHVTQRFLGVLVWRWEGEEWADACEVAYQRFEEFKTERAMQRPVGQVMAEFEARRRWKGVSSIKSGE